MVMNSDTGRIQRPLSADDIAQLCADFEASDADADGRVNYIEFENLLQSIGSQMSVAQRRSEFRRIDADDNGLIDIAEFKRWWQGE
jgi:Ca2+-binding EF-hand superfamily protein